MILCMYVCCISVCIHTVCVCVHVLYEVMLSAPRCVSYSLLPPMCKLVDVAGECCPKVQCDTATTPAAECRDKIDNCYQYRKSSCSGAFEAWARDHCPLFCEFCSECICVCVCVYVCVCVCTSAYVSVYVCCVCVCTCVYI